MRRLQRSLSDAPPPDVPLSLPFPLVAFFPFTLFPSILTLIHLSKFCITKRVILTNLFRGGSKKNLQRSSAGPTDSARCKLSVIADASAELALNLSPGKLLPYEEHFHPTASKAGKPSRQPDSRKIGHPMVGINLLPHGEQVIGNAMLEKWDYCLRRLFVLKGQSVKAAIGYVQRFTSLESLGSLGC